MYFESAELSLFAVVITTFPKRRLGKGVDYYEKYLSNLTLLAKIYELRSTPCTPASGGHLFIPFTEGDKEEGKSKILALSLFGSGLSRLGRSIYEPI